jgi:predicted Kef-type K+ transport protein
MNLKEIPAVGKIAVLTGLGQIGFTVLVGFLVASLLGYSAIVALYIAVALSFSSTIIIIKLLSEKKDLESLYGKVAIGFLLVQDLVAILILMFLSGLKVGEAGIVSFVILLLKAIVLFVSVWYLSKKFLPKIFAKLVGNSQELLFIVSIAWALGISSLVGGPMGFSFEIGGFLAGLALSNLPEHIGIASKTRPLRDFFLTIFFVSLGSQMIISDVGSIIFPAVVFSALVLVGNPLIVMILMGLLGHKSRTSFLASVTVAQISEFSFILMAMGVSLGHLTSVNLTTIILVGAITMVGSTYLILGSEKLYVKLKRILKIFEKRETREAVKTVGVDFRDHIVLVGCDQIGSIILPYFIKRQIPIVVIDFNPSVFNKLSSQNVSALLGDVLDDEIIEKANLKNAKAVICTVPNVEENINLLNIIKTLREKPMFIGSSIDKQDATKLYETGADYVLDPDIIAGEFLRHLFLSHGINKKRIVRMGKSHFNRLLFGKIYA